LIQLTEKLADILKAEDWCSACLGLDLLGGEVDGAQLRDHDLHLLRAHVTALEGLQSKHATVVDCLSDKECQPRGLSPLRARPLAIHRSIRAGDVCPPIHRPQVAPSAVALSEMDSLGPRYSGSGDIGYGFVDFRGPKYRGS
jgi:hypothetical protein